MLKRKKARNLFNKLPSDISQSNQEYEKKFTSIHDDEEITKIFSGN